MRYLGIEPQRPRLAVFDFTCCEGCELQLANKEDTLGPFLAAIEVVNFREISSEKREDYEIALIEGAVSRADETDRLRRIRKQAKIVVAFGSCACYGGVNRMKNAYSLDAANREVYGDKPKETDLVRPVKEIIKVDLEIPGCPVNKEEVERIVQHLVMGVPYNFPVYPVCVECKMRGTVCRYEYNEICLGVVTRAGCNAPCPSAGFWCFGCRGYVDDPNVQAAREVMEHYGKTMDDLKSRLLLFGSGQEKTS